MQSTTTNILSLIVTSILIAFVMQHHTFDPYSRYDDPNETQSFMNRQAKPYLQLLRTCRQFYLEASRVLWITNTFSFNNPETLKKFMKDRKTTQKQLLKNLHMNMPWHCELPKRGWEKALTVTLVRSLKGLRTFHLYIEQCILNKNSTFMDTPDWETNILRNSFFLGDHEAENAPTRERHSQYRERTHGIFL
jgi:hypothetical protein